MTPQERTSSLLAQCAKAGYTVVSVGCKTDMIESANEWPFGCRGSIFAGWPKRRREPQADGRPAIWIICDRLGVGTGCGNWHQHNIKDGMLVDGVYRLKNGEWMVVEAESRP